LSKVEPAFRGSVTHGKVCLDDKQAYMVWLAGLEGKEIELLVRKRVKKRTTAQLRYLFGVVYEVPLKHSEDFGGWSKDEIHDAMLAEHSYDFVNGLKKIKRTSDMSTAELTEYIDAVKRFMAERNIFIPDAGEVWE